MDQETMPKISDGWMYLLNSRKWVCCLCLKLCITNQEDQYYYITQQADAQFSHKFPGLNKTQHYKKIPSERLVSIFPWEFYTLVDYNKSMFLLTCFHNGEDGN